MIMITETHGGTTRRCNGTCHRAKRPTCRCICGGEYHGLGDQGARTLHDRDWKPVVDALTTTDLRFA